MYSKVVRTISKVSMWGTFAIVFLVSIDTVLRYAFNAPTKWGLEAAIYVAGSLYVLSGCVPSMSNQHIRLDVFLNRFGATFRSWFEAVWRAVLLILLAFTFWASCRWSWYSVSMREKSGSAWDAPLWPVKLAMTVGLGLIVGAEFVMLVRAAKQAMRLLFTPSDEVKG